MTTAKPIVNRPVDIRHDRQGNWFVVYSDGSRIPWEVWVNQTSDDFKDGEDLYNDYA